MRYWSGFESSNHNDDDRRMMAVAAMPPPIYPKAFGPPSGSSRKVVCQMCRVGELLHKLGNYSISSKFWI